jgi:hypothetical protein
MRARIYLDTVAFREVGKAFEKKQLSSDLKDRIFLSPLTVFEVLSQLTIEKGDEVLSQIRAFYNWTNPEHAGMLPWPDDMLFQLWFKKSSPDDGFTKRMEMAFNVCLAADSTKKLQEEAGKLKDLMDRMRQDSAQNFGRLVEAARREPFEGEGFSNVWFRGIAAWVKADPSSKSVSEIVSILNAYHEFEENKLKTAVKNKGYNPEKRKNDLFDAEQLIYLGDSSLCFVTCDTGFQNLVKKSPQAERIFVLTLAELADAKKVDAVLRVIVELVEE